MESFEAISAALFPPSKESAIQPLTALLEDTVVSRRFTSNLKMTVDENSEFVGSSLGSEMSSLPRKSGSCSRLPNIYSEPRQT